MKRSNANWAGTSVHARTVHRRLCERYLGTFPTNRAWGVVGGVARTTPPHPLFERYKVLFLEQECRRMNYPKLMISKPPNPVSTHVESGGYFKPHNDPNKPDFDPNVEPFVISIPRPTDRRAAPRACHVRQHGRSDDPLSSHEGLLHPVGAGSDHAGIATQLQVEKMLRNEALRAKRLAARIPAPDVGMEAQIRWHDPETRSAAWRLLRLGSGALHPGRRTVSRSPRGLCQLYEKGLIYVGPSDQTGRQA